MFVIKAVWGIISFLAVEAFVFLPLYLVGLPVAFFAQSSASTEVVDSMVFQGRRIVAYKNRLLNWWVGNYEDGIDPEFDWWSQKNTPFKWFLRNPVCNLRFTPIISTKPSVDTKHVGTSVSLPKDGEPGWFLCWSGWYVGFRYQNTKWGVWLGWKVIPLDATHVASDDYRRSGIGLAAQFMRF